MRAKRKRTDLSLQQQIEVLHFYAQNMSQTDIAKRYNCSQAQISRIIQRRESIIDEAAESCNTARKRKRSGKASDVESALSVWFADARARNVPINDALLEEKAKEFACRLDKPDFIPTNGWLYRWKSRQKIHLRRPHVGAGLANAHRRARAEYGSAQQQRAVGALPNVLEMAHGEQTGGQQQSAGGGVVNLLERAHDEQPDVQHTSAGGALPNVLVRTHDEQTDAQQQGAGGAVVNLLERAHDDPADVQQECAGGGLPNVLEKTHNEQTDAQQQSAGGGLGNANVLQEAYGERPEAEQQ